MLDKPDPLAAAALLVQGYHAQRPLAETEIAALWGFACMRLCASVCINAHQSALEPGNEYLNVDVKPAWELLHYLRGIDAADARAILFPNN